MDAFEGWKEKTGRKNKANKPPTKQEYRDLKNKFKGLIERAESGGIN
jgi:hypothetical protein